MTVPPWLYTPPPKVLDIPPLIVRPERAAEPPLTLKTPFFPPPLTVRAFAPGPVIRRRVLVGENPGALGQGDRLRRVEQAGEDDRVSPDVRIRLGNRLARSLSG